MQVIGTALPRIEYGEFKGNVRQYSLHGHYELHYITSDGSRICATCVNFNELDDIVGYEINWEDTNVYCSCCGDHIEPNYEIEENEGGDKK